MATTATPAVLRCTAPGCAAGRGLGKRTPVARIVTRLPPIVRTNASLNTSAAATPGVSTPCNKKVFEDSSHGIVCYRTGSGEIMCEGYDEGPHFHPSALQQRQSCIQQREASRALLLNATGSWLHYLDASEVKCQLLQGGDLLCEGRDES